MRKLLLLVIMVVAVLVLLVKNTNAQEPSPVPMPPTVVVDCLQDEDMMVCAMPTSTTTVSSNEVAINRILENSLTGPNDLTLWEKLLVLLWEVEYRCKLRVIATGEIPYGGC